MQIYSPPTKMRRMSCQEEDLSHVMKNKLTESVSLNQGIQISTSTNSSGERLSLPHFSTNKDAIKRLKVSTVCLELFEFC